MATLTPGSPPAERTASPTTPIPATVPHTTTTTPAPITMATYYKYNPSTAWQQHTNSGWRRRPPASTSRRRTTGLRPATSARGARAISVPADGVVEFGLIVREAALAASGAVSTAEAFDGKT